MSTIEKAIEKLEKALTVSADSALRQEHIDQQHTAMEDVLGRLTAKASQ